ncbi:MAG: MBL fold metallo-hydrolase [Bacteroidetes bacterium]|jgi:metallo-beta-lactamase family protein|nr:MBL fold metallo-hydrolase [Bacteroidota bacterium]HQW46423.1 MBL fold metallo-hydrolase [Chitinophagaceae bacterium]MBK6818290.1 MBL fold metallo-hydrolase [Bacteroidota bacterium]MBK7587171.1 MBL fold metallo-hydrolase [Bacteroidota bacterium]MBK8328310.1 MBL fold metallo-hydrolase [Bacteroidota bacterium]
MKITFHGAAQTVTGSKHLIHLKNGKKILLDCGLFQGMGEDTLTLNTHFGFDPQEVTYMILSHAHIDHSGLLPKLVKEGYKGKIYCTPATADLTTVMLQDSAFIQEADVAFVNKRRAQNGLPYIKPLYTIADANNVFPLFEEVPYGQVTQIDDDISFHYTDTGHILGSAAIHVTIREGGKQHVITFSGDVGRYRDVILRSPEVFPQSDYIIIESTYGDSLHEDYRNTPDDLLKHIVETCLENKGKLIIPAFSVGRTQEILFALNQLEIEGRLPDLPYYVDSPLSFKTTQIIKQHADLFNNHVQKLMKLDKYPFDFKGLKFIEDVQDSKHLNTQKYPMVIISASGMAEAGRVKHHIANNIENPRNKILMTGYCEPHSLGARLLRGDKEVKIYREEFTVKCQIDSIRSMSAHGDYDDLCQFLACQHIDSVKELFIVHGEHEVQKIFQKRLIKKGFKSVQIPAMHETCVLE